MGRSRVNRTTARLAALLRVIGQLCGGDEASADHGSRAAGTFSLWLACSTTM